MIGYRLITKSMHLLKLVASFWRYFLVLNGGQFVFMSDISKLFKVFVDWFCLRDHIDSNFINFIKGMT